MSTTMLHQVLEAVAASDGAVDLRCLSRSLGVEPGALEGMIQFWVRKGKLVDSRTDGPPSAAASCRSCDVSCSAATACPFIMGAPRTVSVTQENHPEG